MSLPVHANSSGGGAYSVGGAYVNAICVDTFDIFVPLNYDCSLIRFEDADRSERWAFELTGLRNSVGWINLHVVTLTNASFNLLDSSVEVPLVPFLRLHESGVGRSNFIVQPSCVIVLLFGCETGTCFTERYNENLGRGRDSRRLNGVMLLERCTWQLYEYVSSVAYLSQSFWCSLT